MSRLLVSGSSGLIGSEMVAHFAALGWDVHGVDSNQRAVFFGPGGDTRWMQQRLIGTYDNFRHHELDVRDRAGIDALVRDLAPDAIVHAAAQPSHDRAAAIPFDDFDTNAVGTLNLLQAARTHCAEAPFVHFSTNKVYGDAPNELRLNELETRWDYADAEYAHGIPEDFRIDRSTHSIFGASKVAADIMVQEYGRYFGMRTCSLRGGCLTGPSHAGVELHGFLSYLVKCNLEGRTYRIFGYKGKQVRDNIHSRDVAKFAEAFIAAPRVGEVYNLGGGKGNACSIMEAFTMVEARSGKPMATEYDQTNRIGDHICYYSDLRKMMAHYPGWSITVPLATIFDEIVEAWRQRLK
jgi:CDP-paratose 2-epimerase